MPAKKWTAARKAAHSRKIKKALANKKNGQHRIAAIEVSIAKDVDRLAIRAAIRSEIFKQLPAIIEEEVRSALS